MLLAHFTAKRYKIIQNTTKSNKAAHQYQYDILTSILGVKPTSIDGYWVLTINEDSKLFNGAINYFLDLIENSNEKFKRFCIIPEDISIWYLYEYDQI